MSTSRPNRNAYKRAWEAERAVTLRRELLALFGNKCCQCGERHKLEFNHLYEHEDRVRHLCRYRRMLLYRKLIAAKQMNVLCKLCNRRYVPLPF